MAGHSPTSRPGGQLSGTLPAELGALTALTDFDFAHNNAPISGTLPSQLGLMVGLTASFSVYENGGISGTIPTQVRGHRVTALFF